MKFILTALVACALSVCAMADVTGRWLGKIEAMDGAETHTDDAYLILKQDGATLTGSGGPNEGHQIPLRNGKVDGTKMTVEIALENDRVMSFDLEASGDTLTGDVHGQDKTTGEAKAGKLSFKRVAEK